ncbi:hypothetical protein PR202_ga00672 [Eleusine coracana subsp. coracana]|uniref:F-box domain-containing protein n=1 Tax=Eleusine coracana subsp. coracana TaxID=191504 RepID=A0AAV5BH48_ELECO|nr:hypothetical protein PR202_ga00672 [Eleusine coracana subsp. coracana]
MEDVAEMLSRGFDFSLMDMSTRTMMHQVYASLPPPPTRTAAPLASAAAARAPEDGIDRISRLPVEILRDIVSRLPAKDAARTTALAKRWRRVWHSVPLVLVDAHLLPGRARAARPRRFMDILTAPRGVADAVSRALAAHPGPFRCVYLTGTPMDAHRAEATLWLQLLAAKGIQDLVFVNRATKFALDLELPATLFKCSSLTRLYLGCWKFPGTAALPRVAAFPYLQETRPQFLCIRVQSSSLRCVEVCAGMVPEITVVHASRLERILLWEAWGFGPLNNLISRIKIGHAPKLRILGFLVAGMHQLEIGNTIIKVGTKASPSTTVPSVKMLGVQVKFGARNEARMLPSFLRCFPNVETLYVQSEDPEFKIGHRGPQPGSSGNGKLDLKLWEEAGPIECVQRHIKKLVLREFRGQRCDLDFLKFIAERALKSWRRW